MEGKLFTAILLAAVAATATGAKVCKKIDFKGTSNHEHFTCAMAPGTELVLSERVKEDYGLLHCCDKGASPEEVQKFVDDITTKCRKSPCAPKNSSDPCDTLDEFLEIRYKGSKMDLPPLGKISRDSCELEDGTVGEFAYCCRQGSEDLALASTFGAEFHEFPYMAFILMPHATCGGSIYNKRHIITAAHCIVESAKDKLHTLFPVTPEWKAKLGRNIRSSTLSANEYTIVELIPHPDYSIMEGSPELKKKYPRFFNDIAILRLDRDIVFGDSIKPLLIAPKGLDELKHGENIIISGWGKTNTGVASENLQRANLIMRRDTVCFGPNSGGVSPNQWENRESLLCIGGNAEGRNSPVVGSGDSGSPAVCRDADGFAVHCGVVSLTAALDPKKCAEMADEANCKPGIATELDYFVDWINATAGEQDPSVAFRTQVYGEITNVDHQVRIESDTGKNCGGTLVEPDIVVTAAQCVASGNGKSYTGLKVRDGNQELGIKNVAVHPAFGMIGAPVDVAAQGDHVIRPDNEYKNDLAMIKLKSPVSRSNLPGLPTGKAKGSAMEYAAPKNTTWGAELRAREFNILDKTECQKRWDHSTKYGWYKKLQEKVICGVEKFSGGSQCDRELGGGLICKGENGKETLCGVQSFRLCELSLPNSFVDVVQYSEWVEQTKQQL